MDPVTIFDKCILPLIIYEVVTHVEGLTVDEMQDLHFQLLQFTRKHMSLMYIYYDVCDICFTNY